MTKIYGIPNCNSVKKARVFLEGNGVDYVFVDFKKVGADRVLLQKWIRQFGWEKVINRAGMTWRKLTDAQKEAIQSDEDAVKLAEENPSIIKRPILESGDFTLLGFKEADYQSLLG